VKIPRTAKIAFYRPNDPILEEWLRRGFPELADQKEFAITDPERLAEERAHFIDYHRVTDEDVIHRHALYRYLTKDKKQPAHPEHSHATLAEILEHLRQELPTKGDLREAEVRLSIAIFVMWVLMLAAIYLK